jgi:hypothetical protein
VVPFHTHTETFASHWDLQRMAVHIHLAMDQETLYDSEACFYTNMNMFIPVL